MIKKKVGKILWWRIVLISIISILGAIIIMNFNQELEYNSNVSCSKIKDCILLEISCFDIKVKNNVFAFEWEFKQEASINTQKRIYKEECLK